MHLITKQIPDKHEQQWELKTSTHLSLSYTMFSKFDDSEIPFADGFLDVVETDTHRLRLSLGSLQRGSVGHHHHSRTTDHDNIRQGLSIVCPAFSRVNILDRLRTGDMPSCSQVSCCLAACALSPARAWRWPPLRWRHNYVMHYIIGFEGGVSHSTVAKDGWRRQIVCDKKKKEEKKKKKKR